MWMSGFAQYTNYRGAGPALDSLAGRHDEPAAPGAITAPVLGPAAGAATRLESAAWLREDTLWTADGVRRCDVVAATYRVNGVDDTARTRRELWVSRGDGLVWRHGTREERPIGQTGQVLRRSQFVTFTRQAVGGSPADTLFEFHAPEGSREVLAFSPPGQRGLDLTGREAPPFALRDPDGVEHDLAADSGQVVLLDFWATWCGPCRMTMPALDRLTREFAGHGLVVYSVNLREKPETAVAYMKKYGYSMTTLLDPDGSTAQRYGVSAIPVMVVVGRDGKVAAHLTGAHGEATMRAALGRAGIE
jgi:thiol-disulfide isomerase/thioredoxin